MEAGNGYGMEAGNEYKMEAMGMDNSCTCDQYLPCLRFGRLPILKCMDWIKMVK